MATFSKAEFPRRPGVRRGEQAARDAILEAALHEFSREGVAGARTDAIARAAGVNKALLYYYFRDKEALYGAVLDRVFAGLLKQVMPVLNGKLPPRQRLLAYAAAHFDYIASFPPAPRLVQSEMLRSMHGSPHLKRIVRRYMKPLFERLVATLLEGMERGELRRADPAQMAPSMISVIVFYFTSRPVAALLWKEDPLSAKRIAARREAVLDFIDAAITSRAVAGRNGSPAGRDRKQRRRTQC